MSSMLKHNAEEEEHIWTALSSAFAQTVLPQPDANATPLAAPVLSAMRRARDLVCVPDRWMRTSKKHRYEAGLAAVTKAVKEMPLRATGSEVVSSVPDVDCPDQFLPSLVCIAETLGHDRTLANDSHMKVLMAALLRKGFHTEDADGAPFDIANYEQFSGAYRSDRYDALYLNLFLLPRRDKATLAVGLYVIYALCTKDEVGAIMTRIADHMTVCQPGQQQGADYLFAVAGSKLDEQGGHESNDEEGEEVLELGFYNYCHNKLLGRVAVGVEPTTFLDTPAATSATNELQELRRKFEGYFMDYLDAHKDRALFSAVFEPVKYVLTATGKKGEADNLDVHGQNWYLVAMIEALGEAAYPILPVEDDFSQQSTIHPYGNLTIQAVKAFQDPSNFGKGFGAIKSLRDNAGLRKKNRVTHQVEGDHRFGQYSTPSKVRDVFTAERKHEAGDAEVNEAHQAPEDLKNWAVMAEHLAYFFCADFFIPKCFETLSAETKPEYLGFRQCCIKLFQHYKASPEFQQQDTLHQKGKKESKEQKEKNVQEEEDDTDTEEEEKEEGELLDQDGEFYAHCYQDEYYTQLDTDAVTQFFEWLKVVKSQGTYTAKPEERDYAREILEEERMEQYDLNIDQERIAWQLLVQGALSEKNLIRQAELREKKAAAKREKQSRKLAARAQRGQLKNPQSFSPLDELFPQEEGGFGVQDLFAEGVSFAMPFAPGAKLPPAAKVPPPSPRSFEEEEAAESAQLLQEMFAKVEIAAEEQGTEEEGEGEGELKMERLISVEVMLSPASTVMWDDSGANSFEGDFDTAPAIIRMV